MRTLALLAVAGVASTAAAQTLTIDITADNTEVTGAGDATVNFTVTVSTSDLVTNGSGAVADFGFDLGLADAGYTFTSNGWDNTVFVNAFGPTFNDDGAATDGVGIAGANGQNSPPPVGAPADNNSMALYTFSIDVTDFSDRSFSTAFALNAATTATPGAIAAFPNILDWLAGGGNVVINDATVTVVPAPASAGLLALGGLAAARRRR